MNERNRGEDIQNPKTGSTLILFSRPPGQPSDAQDLQTPSAVLPLSSSSAQLLHVACSCTSKIQMPYLYKCNSLSHEVLPNARRSSSQIQVLLTVETLNGLVIVKLPILSPSQWRAENFSSYSSFFFPPQLIRDCLNFF